MNTEPEPRLSRLLDVERALARYISQWPGEPVTSPRLPRLRRRPYCGHLGTQAELETALWGLVRACLDPAEEKALSAHAQGCAYCQGRIRDISKALRAAADEPWWLAAGEPSPAYASLPVTVRIRLRRAKEYVEQAGEVLLANVLKVVETTGTLVSGRQGGVMVLAPAPSFRGAGDDTASEGPPSPAEDVCESVAVASETAGLRVTGEVRLAAAGPELVVRCADADGKRPTGNFSIVWEVDGAVEEPRELGPTGAVALPLPGGTERIDATVLREEIPVGGVSVDVDASEV